MLKAQEHDALPAFSAVMLELVIPLVALGVGVSVVRHFGGRPAPPETPERNIDVATRDRSASFRARRWRSRTAPGLTSARATGRPSLAHRGADWIG